MYSNEEIQDYLDEIREQVCSRCIERPPGGPPCYPLGKHCGVEMHLSTYLDAIHKADSPLIEPYLDNVNRRVCTKCLLLDDCDRCPCPLDYLSVLVVQAVETVDQRRQQGVAEALHS